MKTIPTSVEVIDYISKVPTDTRRADCQQLVDLMQAVTSEPPVMWGPSIVGFGKYHYKYASGREGDMMRVGFSARKEHLVCYGLLCDDQDTQLLDRLGKYSQGKGCLYIKKLADVDLDILGQMVGIGFGRTISDEAPPSGDA